jgi:signal peptidase complex subunit 3
LKSRIKALLITFKADLTPLFNWNVKQLFLYLTAEYSTPNNQVTFAGNFSGRPPPLIPLLFQINQVVLWDKIIQRGENAALDYRSMNTKYYFWDDGNGLK